MKGGGGVRQREGEAMKDLSLVDSADMLRRVKLNSAPKVFHIVILIDASPFFCGKASVNMPFIRKPVGREEACMSLCPVI